MVSLRGVLLARTELNVLSLRTMECISELQREVWIGPLSSELLEDSSEASIICSRSTGVSTSFVGLN